MIYTNSRSGPNLGFLKPALVRKGNNIVPGDPGLSRAGAWLLLLSASATALSREGNGAGKIWGSVTNQRCRFPCCRFTGLQEGFTNRGEAAGCFALPRFQFLLARAFLRGSFSSVFFLRDIV